MLLFTHPCSPILTHVFADNSNTPRHARVAVPVADLRQEPSKPLPTLEHDRGQPVRAVGSGAASESRSHDPLEESQLLYGDPVEILEEKEGWARVAAVEQPEHTHNKRWEGYPGWIENSSLLPSVEPWNPNLIVDTKWAAIFSDPASNAEAKLTVSFGTQLVGLKKGDGWELRLLDGSFGWISNSQVISQETLLQLQKDAAAFRKRLVDNARLFLEDPYYWGGRSAEKIDCSGLVGLVYQANGLHIPRDAHEQWMLSKPVDPKNLSPGDLVFLHDPEDPDRIVHVMMSVGQDEIIEAPGTGGVVRQMNFQERLKEAKGRRISFGTYIL